MPRTEPELLDTLVECFTCPSCQMSAYVPRWVLDMRTSRVGRGQYFTETGDVVAWCPWCHRLVGQEFVPGTDYLRAVNGREITVTGYGSFIVGYEVKGFTDILGAAESLPSWAILVAKSKVEKDRRIAWLKAAIHWFLGDD